MDLRKKKQTHQRVSCQYICVCVFSDMYSVINNFVFIADKVTHTDLQDNHDKEDTSTKHRKSKKHKKHKSKKKKKKRKEGKDSSSDTESDKETQKRCEAVLCAYKRQIMLV